MSEAASILRRRTLIILGAAAAVSALLGAGSFMPPPQDMPRSEVGQRVLPAFQSKVGLISLVMVTTEEESYHLVKNADGWVMPEKGNYPVHPARIQELTQALSDMAYARAMSWWRARHRWCSACGAPATPQRAGHVVRCSNEACGIEVFPRIDPAIIVLVTDGDRALLGRQASWPPRRYSTIAGFVEPGESLEDAVAREVEEETGVRIASASYHSSQPWPFPSSLMLGFTAEALPGAIACADAELEDARWFSREQLARGEALLPPRTSISHRLIEQWFDAGSPQPLATLGQPGW